MMAAEWPQPMRFGIGIHGGEAIVGEVGYRDNMVLTALGDPANVASRLKDCCKEFACEVVISDQVCAASGLALSDLPLRTVELPGREGPVALRIVTRAADLAARFESEKAA